MLNSDPNPIQLLNLDQIQAGSFETVKIQIGYATFHLRWTDVDALQSRLAKPSQSRDIVIAKCHFRLSTEGRKLLQTVVEQAINAKATYEQRQQRRTQEQQVEEKWLRCLRRQD